MKSLHAGGKRKVVEVGGKVQRMRRYWRLRSSGSRVGWPLGWKRNGADLIEVTQLMASSSSGGLAKWASNASKISMAILGASSERKDCPSCICMSHRGKKKR